MSAGTTPTRTPAGEVELLAAAAIVETDERHRAFRWIAHCLHLSPARLPRGTEIPEDVHRDAKAAAGLEGHTLRQFLIDALAERAERVLQQRERKRNGENDDQGSP